MGGIAGALVGMGIPEIEAKRYEGKIKGGNILISVHTSSGDEQKRVEAIYKSNAAHDIFSASEASVPAVHPATAAATSTSELPRSSKVPVDRR